MNPLTLLKGAGVAIKAFTVANATPIGLAATGIGLVVTGILAWKAGKKSSLVIGKAKIEKGEPLTKVEKVKATWKLWLPVVASIVLTFGAAAGTYYIQSTKIAELSATVNTLMASNKELYSEIDELKSISPEEVEKVEDKSAWKYHDTHHNNGHGGVMIYDPFLCKHWYDDIDVVAYAKSKCIDHFKEQGEITLGDMYYIFGQKLRGSIANWKLIEDFSNHNNPDGPGINLRKTTRIRDDDEVEEMWVLEYDRSVLINPDIYDDRERVIDLHDEITDDYNDDELMSTINNAFA